jgi:hypothetical protein
MTAVAEVEVARLNLDFRSPSLGPFRARKTIPLERRGAKNQILRL